MGLIIQEPPSLKLPPFFPMEICKWFVTHQHPSVMRNPQIPSTSSEATGPINLESNMLNTLPVGWSSNLPRYIYHLLSGDGNFHSTPISLG